MNIQRLLHQLLGVVFFILAFTGFLVHSETLRVPMADFRFFLRTAHLIAGAFFIACFFANTPYLWAFRQGKADGLNRREYLWLLVLVCACIIVSGGGLLAVMTLGYLEREHSWLFHLHVITMEIGALIIFPHVLYSIVRHYQNHGEMKKTVTDNEHQHSGRRDFLRYVVGEVAVAF